MKDDRNGTVAHTLMKELARAIDARGRDGAARTELVGDLAKLPAVRDWSKKELNAEVAGVLERMAALGEVVSRAQRWYSPRALGFKRGRLERTGRRDFRVRDLSAPPGTFVEVGQKDLAGARQGDTVLFQPPAQSGRGKTSASRGDRQSQSRSRSSSSQRGAKVAKVLSRGAERWVGLLTFGRDRLEFIPFDHRMRHDARDLDTTRLRDDPALRGADLKRGVFVSIEPQSRAERSRPARPERSKSSARRGSDRGQQASEYVAASVEIIGTPDQPNIETKVVMAHFGFDDHWSKESRREEQELVEGPQDMADRNSESAGSPADSAGGGQRSRRGRGRDGKKSAVPRRDLRSTVTFTIDGASARDFDDALSITKRPEGFRLWVHIADVSHYVRPGSAIDRGARERGTSVYFADRAVHMLPAGLSENLCSLRPEVDRRGLTVEMDFDHDGHRTASRFYPSLIRSDARLTYRQVEDFYLRRGTIEDAAVRKALGQARRLAQLLLERRAERGTFEIEQQIGAFQIGEDGKPTDYVTEKRFLSHKLIEEFMIQANVAVAEALAERLESVDDDSQAIGLFRRHDPPASTDLEEFAEQVSALGIPVPETGIEEVGDLRAVLEAVEDRPVRPFVEALLLRSLKRAIYVSEVAPHFALGLDAYCHFTSPIRRYPDLVVHRCLKALLLADETHLPTGGEATTGEELAEALSSREQQAERAEREQFRWRMVRWLKEKEGESLPVTITGIQDFGLFVLLNEYGIDGLIPFDEVPGGEAEVITQGVSISVEGHGRNRDRVFRLGDSLDAVLVRADEFRRQVLLSLDSATSAQKRSEERRGVRDKPRAGGKRQRPGRKRTARAGERG